MIALICLLKECFTKIYNVFKMIVDKIFARFERKIKVAIFLFIAVGVFCVCNYIVQPIWDKDNEYNSLQGFYEEPENTIETIFLGASITAYGFIPAELYEDYGICSCNLGTSRQPMLASYYWLEEAYRLHSETLDTIVLDVSMLRKESPEANYHQALDHMKLSSVKLHAIKKWADDFDEALSYLFPIFSYHERWKSLTETDFEKSEEEANISSRGYWFTTTRTIDKVSSYSEIALPLYIPDEGAVETEFNSEALYYLEKMITFCEEKSIKLVLTKTLQNGWNFSNHNGAEAIAEEYGLDFIDFNFEPYLLEVGFNYSTDFYDSNTHMNYYGATKFTNWFGNYLIEECDNCDVRGDERYAFMEDELADYHRNIASIKLNEMTDPVEYISYLMEQDDYVIFISAKDEASSKLTQTQRDMFASMGLEKLSTLGYRASYLTVIDEGEIVVELTKEDPGSNEEGQESKYRGSLDNGVEYEITSGGHFLGNTSSVLIDGKNYSKNSKGLNMVVYDKKLEEVIDHVCFDTCSASERESLDYGKRLEDMKEAGTPLSELSGIDRQLYLYDRACRQEKLSKTTLQQTGDSGLISYLDAFWKEDGCAIYISAKEEAANALTDDVRDALREMGLTELADLGSGDSYIAVVENGTILAEETSHDTSPLEVCTNEYKLISGGADSGNISSIMIDGTEYSNR
ncbi:MAG: hypothetical protein LUE86_02915 [Clostridiales bacterium]|nr:hypothetical protein [Clostridiales bacterium]